MTTPATRLSPTERTLRARLAAHESWANTVDRTARTKAAHGASPASVGYWLDKVDPDHEMKPAARVAAARSKRNAHMTRLALSAAKARRQRRAAA